MLTKLIVTLNLTLTLTLGRETLEIELSQRYKILNDELEREKREFLRKKGTRAIMVKGRNHTIREREIHNPNPNPNPNPNLNPNSEGADHPALEESQVKHLQKELHALKEEMQVKVNMCEELLDAVKACGLFSDSDLKLFEETLLPQSPPAIIPFSS